MLKLHCRVPAAGPLGCAGGSVATCGADLKLGQKSGRLAGWRSQNEQHEAINESRLFRYVVAHIVPTTTWCEGVGSVHRERSSFARDAMYKRTIVYPQGTPSRTAAASHCSELVQICGGDMERQFERTEGSLSQFGAYLARLTAFQHRHVQVLVVMTQTRPVELIVPTRRLLTRVPGLDDAVWVLFWDHMADSGFPECLVEYGTLDGPADAAPLWRPSSGGRPFLILSTLVTADVVRNRVGGLGEASPRVSEIRGLKGSESRTG